MTRRILYLFLISAPLIIKADECQTLKGSILQLGRNQLSLQSQGKTLSLLQGEQEKAQAKLIVLQGIKELKIQYGDFLTEAQKIEITPENIGKIKDFQETLKQGVVASKKISAAYNFFEHIQHTSSNDIHDTCRRIAAEELSDGTKFCEIIQEEGEGQNEVNDAMQGLVDAIKIANGGQDDKTKRKAFKAYADTIDADIPKHLLTVETINKIETAQNTLDSTYTKFQSCVDASANKTKNKCFDHLIFGQQTVEEVQKFHSSMPKNLQERVFKAQMEESFGDLDTISQSIKILNGEAGIFNVTKEDKIKEIQQNYMISRQKRYIRASIQGDSTQVPSGIPDVKTIYREIFDNLLDGTSSTSCPQGSFTLDKLSSCLDAVVKSDQHDVDSLDRQLATQKELVSKLSTGVAAIMLGEDYIALDNAKNAFAEELDSCSSLSIINCRQTGYNLEDEVLKTNDTPHRLLMDGNNIIGHLPIRKPGSTEITTFEQIDQANQQINDDHCDNPIVNRVSVCQDRDKEERIRRRAQRESESQEVHQTLSDMHRRHNILFEIAPDGDVRTRDLGKRKKWWEYPQVAGSLGMMGVMAVQGHFQNVIWEKTKESIIGQYKYAKAQSWWSRQDCVNTYIGLEYLCMPQGYAYNNSWGSDFGLNPQAAGNFCNGCSYPQSASLPANQALIP